MLTSAAILNGLLLTADLLGYRTWLASRSSAGLWCNRKPAWGRTRNTYRAAAVAFCNWCAETGRLLSNPFGKVAKADEDVDPRRQRRALTEDELRRLLDVARRRPVLDAMTVRRGKNKGEAVAELRGETRQRLERLGWERALLYKTLVLTGLRKGSWLRSPSGNGTRWSGALPDARRRGREEPRRLNNPVAGRSCR